MEDNIIFKHYMEEYEDKRSKKVFVTLVYVLLAVFLTFFCINIAFQQNYRYIIINGASMQNTLNPNPVGANQVQDGVYIKLTQDVDYGDIVVVDKEDEEGSIIKRLLAFGGDKISIVSVELEDGSSSYRLLRIKKGTSSVEVVEEDYIKSYKLWNTSVPYVPDNGVNYEYNFYQNYVKNKSVSYYTFQGQSIAFSTIPEGHMFYMGDNRSASYDARQTGTHSTSLIIGKVVVIARNAATLENSPFCWLYQLKAYFSIIWEELVDYFAVKV